MIDVTQGIPAEPTILIRFALICLPIWALLFTRTVRTYLVVWNEAKRLGMPDPRIVNGNNNKWLAICDKSKTILYYGNGAFKHIHASGFIVSEPKTCSEGFSVNCLAYAPNLTRFSIVFRLKKDAYFVHQLSTLLLRQQIGDPSARQAHALNSIGQVKDNGTGSVSPHSTSTTIHDQKECHLTAFAKRASVDEDPGDPPPCGSTNTDEPQVNSNDQHSKHYSISPRKSDEHKIVGKIMKKAKAFSGHSKELKNDTLKCMEDILDNTPTQCLHKLSAGKLSEEIVGRLLKGYATDTIVKDVRIVLAEVKRRRRSAQA